MWLLDISTFDLHEFTGSNIPPYAILSHTWGSEEVSFKEMRKHRQAAEQKAAFAKIKGCCLEAARDGLQRVWVDSCCIDKRSSAELSEAINSLYKCPSSPRDALSQSRWFTLGWTLQELLAPPRIKFFTRDWTLMGVKASLQGPSREPPEIAQGTDFLKKLALITGIGWKVLVSPAAIARTSVAQRMRWASHRRTTREEDIVYSLMGLFDVSMPILYGEGGTRAFKRLQLEIIRTSPDQSIFAWRTPRERSGLLASSPIDFSASELLEPWNTSTTPILPYSMTNIGLSINLPLQPPLGDMDPNVFVAALRCWTNAREKDAPRVIIYLKEVTKSWVGGEKRRVFTRIRCNEFASGEKLQHWDKRKDQRMDVFILEEEQFEFVKSGLFEHVWTS